jgi:hypothetical protein
VFWTTKNFTWAKALIDAMLTALSARPAAALLTTPKLILIKAGGPITPTSAVADFTEANFSGYAQSAQTLAGPVTTASGGQGMLGSGTFVATTASPFVDNNVVGYLVTDGASAFYGGELFDAPQPIAAPGDFVGVNLVMPAALELEP